MDFIPLVTAAVGVVGGALAASWQAWRRNRLDARSAARLIHAELTENTAAIRYFRRIGSWPATNVRHKAWDTYGETLSRMRAAESFQKVQQGYSQLEGIAYLAKPPDDGVTDDGVSFPREATDEILEAAISDVRDALYEAGTVAGTPHHVLRQQIEAMERRSSLGRDRPAHFNGMVIPAAMQDQIARSGTDMEREKARSTLNKMMVIEGTQRVLEVGTAQRNIYDAAGSSSLFPSEGSDFRLVRTEGDPRTGDSAVDEIYDGLGAFYDFFAEVYGRDSIDGHGASLEAVVHYGQHFGNMFWNGQHLIAGDGDGEIFKGFTGALEVVGHEFANAVIQHEGGFDYSGQSGALHESIADVFGVLVKQYNLGQAANDADWLVGADVLAPNIKGEALRSLAAPGTAYDDKVLGKDPQPAHMKDYVETEEDNGGIHINSGIPNHAFYTAATALGGGAWERAGRVWYDAIRDPRLPRAPGFRRFAQATVEAAVRLYGEQSVEADAVRGGWDKVGVKPTLVRKALDRNSNAIAGTSARPAPGRPPPDA